MTLVWQEYDGMSESVPVPWPTSIRRHTTMFDNERMILIAAPGAVVAARNGDPTILGFPAG